VNGRATKHERPAVSVSRSASAKLLDSSPERRDVLVTWPGAEGGDNRSKFWPSVTRTDCGIGSRTSGTSCGSYVRNKT
jgi:hypothetical protein